MANTYSARDILYKEGLEGIKQNPGMYVGDVGIIGYHHLACEVLDNSIDEAIAGYASKITLILHADGSCSVLDDGRGIPTEIHPQYKISTLELVLSKPHAGGKFEKKAYLVSGGMHGLGIKLVTALSEWVKATVYRDGKEYFQNYVEAKPTDSVQIKGDTKLRGTCIHFKPSPKIFKGVEKFDRDWFIKRLTDLAYLNPGLIFNFEDRRQEPLFEQEFIQKGGLSAYVKALNSGQSLLKDAFYISVLEPDGYIKDDGSQDNMQIEMAMNYGELDIDTTLAYTNNVFNRDGGTHVTGFQTALTTTFNNYLKKNPDIISKKEQKDLEDKTLRGEDYRSGLVAVISIKLAHPQFASQTKDRLTTSGVQGAVRTAIGQALNKWVEENPALAKKIIEKAVLNFRSFLASKKAIDTIKRGSVKSLFNGDSKLVDCTVDDPDKSELFIVEGDSAGGSAINARSCEFQAVLPLKGKVLNTYKATAAKMLEHKEISSLIKAIGAGVLDSFEANQCRYNKIIIMCDADVDGLHIRTLLLTFFFQRMRKLIEDGKVYIAQPPLYSFEHKYKKTKCSECNGTGKEKNALRCTLCNSSGKKQEFIVYENEFQLTMEKLGLEKIMLLHLDGRIFKDEAFLEIYNSCKSKNVVELKKLGFIDDEMRDNDLEKDFEEDKIAHKFTLKGTNNRDIEFNNLLNLSKLVLQLGQSYINNLKRYKGLGEMGFRALAQSTINPLHRHLLQIKIDDVVKASAMFETLMGDSAEIRREFIAGRNLY